MNDELIQRLQSCVDEPMWADHAEISKNTLRKVIAALAAHAPQTAEPVAWVEVKDPHEGPYEFHGLKLLDSGKHHLYLAPQAPAPAVAAWPDTAMSRLVPIGFASVVDIESYKTRLTIGTHLPGVRDVAMFTKDQLQAAVNHERNLAAPPLPTWRGEPSAPLVAAATVVAAEFESWLRTVCFQKPTPEAYDLAKCAWSAAIAAAQPRPQALTEEQIAALTVLAVSLSSRSRPLTVPQAESLFEQILAEHPAFAAPVADDVRAAPMLDEDVLWDLYQGAYQACFDLWKIKYEEAARRALSAPKEPASDRVLTDQQCGAIAYQLTKRLVIDMPTARAAVDAALSASQGEQPEAPVAAAEGVLTEIRTIMNGTQHWPIGTEIVDAIRDLALAAQAPQAPAAQPLTPTWWCGENEEMGDSPSTVVQLAEMNAGDRIVLEPWAQVGPAQEFEVFDTANGIEARLVGIEPSAQGEQG